MVELGKETYEGFDSISLHHNFWEGKVEELNNSDSVLSQVRRRKNRGKEEHIPHRSSMRVIHPTTRRGNPNPLRKKKKGGVD